MMENLTNKHPNPLALTYDDSLKDESLNIDIESNNVNKKEDKMANIPEKNREYIDKWRFGLRPIIRMLTLISMRGDIADLKGNKVKDNTISKRIKNEVSQLIKNGDAYMDLLRQGRPFIIAKPRYEKIEEDIYTNITYIMSEIKRGNKSYDENHSERKDRKDLGRLEEMLESLPKQGYKFEKSQEVNMQELIRQYSKAYRDRRNNPQFDDVYSDNATTFNHFFSDN